MLSSLVTGCPTKDSLETCAKYLSTLVNRSTALVAAGVALELVEPIYEFWAWIRRLRFRQKELANFKEVAEFMPTGVKYRRKHVSSDHPRWLKWFGRIGIIFVVLGVIGEASYGADLEDAHNLIHEHDTALLGDAAKSAHSAKADADELRVDLQTTRTQEEAAQGRLEKEQQKTARAQEKAARAQLALKKYLDSVASRQLDRTLDGPRLVNALKGKPKVRVEVWYNPNDTEAFILAENICGWLGDGRILGLPAGSSAGWTVVGLKPTPDETNKNRMLFGNMSTLRLGGITFLTQATPHEIRVRPTTALDFLIDAIMASVTPFGGSEIDAEPTLPNDLIVVVVGPRPTRYFSRDSEKP